MQIQNTEENSLISDLPRAKSIEPKSVNLVKDLYTIANVIPLKSSQSEQSHNSLQKLRNLGSEISSPSPSNLFKLSTDLPSYLLTLLSKKTTFLFIEAGYLYLLEKDKNSIYTIKQVHSLKKLLQIYISNTNRNILTLNFLNEQKGIISPILLKVTLKD